MALKFERFASRILAPPPEEWEGGGGAKIREAKRSNLSAIP
jgi:hypothetical protein